MGLTVGVTKCFIWATTNQGYLMRGYSKWSANLGQLSISYASFDSRH
jgi:hypothetical protein